MPSSMRETGRGTLRDKGRHALACFVSLRPVPLGIRMVSTSS